MSQCVPPIPIRPCVLKYLGKTHNLWFRSTLMLEHQAFEKGLSLQIKPKQTTEFYEQESITPPQQVRLASSSRSRRLCQGPPCLGNPLPSDFKWQHSEVALLGRKRFCPEHSRTHAVFSGDTGFPGRTVLSVTRGGYVGWSMAEALQVFGDGDGHCLRAARILRAGSRRPVSGDEAGPHG